MRRRLTTEQLQAMTKEQLIKHAAATQAELDKAVARAQRFGQALEQMGYFPNRTPGQAQHNQEAPGA